MASIKEKIKAALFSNVTLAVMWGVAFFADVAVVVLGLANGNVPSAVAAMLGAIAAALMIFSIFLREKAESEDDEEGDEESNTESEAKTADESESADGESDTESEATSETAADTKESEGSDSDTESEAATEESADTAESDSSTVGSAKSGEAIAAGEA